MPCREIASRGASRASGSNTRHEPDSRWLWRTEFPNAWWNGRVTSARSAAVRPRMLRRMASALDVRFARLSMTALGGPVLPEVRRIAASPRRSAGGLGEGSSRRRVSRPTVGVESPPAAASSKTIRQSVHAISSSIRSAGRTGGICTATPPARSTP